MSYRSRINSVTKFSPQELMFERKIEAKTEDDHLFQTKCTVKDLWCKMIDSIVVWKDTINHNCDLEYITHGVFNISGSWLESASLNLAFQLAEDEQHCNEKVTRTTEGLFLSNKYFNFTHGSIEIEFYQNRFSEQRIKRDDMDRRHSELENGIDRPASPRNNYSWTYRYSLPDHLANPEGLIDLSLAESDYTKIQIYKNIEREILTECKIFRATLKLFRLTTGYSRFEDFKNQDIFLLSKNGELYKTTCINISMITLYNNLTTCFEDVPVSFYINATKIDAFLNKEAILVTSSKRISCTKDARYIKIKHSKYSLLIEGKSIHIILTKNIKFETVNFVDGISKFALNHIKLITDGAYHSVQLDNYGKIAEAGSVWLIEPDSQSTHTKTDPIGKLKTGLGNFGITISSYIKTIIITLLANLIIIAIIIIATYCLVKRCRKKKSIERNLRFDENIEMIIPDSLNNLTKLKSTSTPGSLDTTTKMILRLK